MALFFYGHSVAQYIFCDVWLWRWYKHGRDWVSEKDWRSKNIRLKTFSFQTLF